MRIHDFLREATKIEVLEYENSVASDPLVSVCVQTYQHEKYIKECIEGILSQETNFKYELLIGEDESNDLTRDICLEYANNHPDTIRLFLHSRKNNIRRAGSATGRFNLLYNFSKARGKYLAICEGDDYWIDTKKLQKQVDLLVADTELSASFTSAMFKYETNSNKDEIYYPLGIQKEQKFSLSELITKNGDFIPTASLFFKSEYIKVLPKWILNAPVGDLPLMLHLAYNGQIGYLPDCTCVYRIMSQGSWSHRMNYAKRVQFVTALVEMYQQFDEYTNREFTQYIEDKIKSIQNQHKRAELKNKIAQCIPLGIIRAISPKLAKRIEYFRE